jgi:Protein of unknown function (DUF1592)/Protein of unknown function (DUF1588)/Protein of unknown function (DUF1585)/Protein of unknown function (DUF1595)/Protein of unknown function (DUF1587)
MNIEMTSFPRILARTLLAIAACAVLAACSREPTTQGGPMQMRRLTEAQYRNAIADIFGADIVVAGRFEPIIRPDQGLIADGAALTAISPAGFEQYDSMARGIASQVVDEAHRATLLPCAPGDPKAPDKGCAKRFYTQVGRLIFRRALSEPEVDAHVAVAVNATRQVGDFYSGLALGLAGMLVSPEFLFRIDTVEPDPGKAGAMRLDGYSKAARLSLFLWNTVPDDELLQAAERGDLHHPRRLRAQVDRMLSSARVVDGARAFFGDMLGFEKFEELSKDALLYPKFNREIAHDAQEQMLRTISHHLLERNADYRSLFTTRETFLTRPLGMVYRVPIPAQSGWAQYEFPEGDPRAGLITQLGFLSLHSHAGRSSATLRGMAIRELLLCQKVPDPPGNVDFAVAQDTTNPLLKTARGRLTAHRNDPTCAGCHRLLDPIGLALENFDAIGEYRALENGEKIDASGDLDGAPFEDAIGLGKALAENPVTSECLVRRAYQYAAGRPPEATEGEFLQYLTEEFGDDGHRFRELLMSIATSDALYRIAPDSAANERGKVAASTESAPSESSS